MSSPPTAAEIVSRLPDWLIEMTQIGDVEPEFLPDPAVIDCIYGTDDPQTLTRANNWITKQLELQEEAGAILERLDTEHPVTLDSLHCSDLPAWLGYPWAMVLHVEWSRNLVDAVIAAATWLEEQDPAVH